MASMMINATELPMTVEDVGIAKNNFLYVYAASVVLLLSSAQYVMAKRREVSTASFASIGFLSYNLPSFMQVNVPTFGPSIWPFSYLMLFKYMFREKKMVIESYKMVGFDSERV